MKMLRVTGAAIAALAIVPFLAAPAAAEPFGYTGVIRDEAGNSIEDACLTLYRTQTAVEAEFCTDADGRYTITGVPTDVSYKVRMVADGFRTEWWYRDPDYLNADVVWVPATALVEQDFTLGVGAGTIRGRITDETGAAADDTTVTVHSVDRGGEWIAYTSVLGDGRFEIPNLAPGQYQVHINDSRHGIQWVPQKDTQWDASIFTLTDGGEVVVDEQWRGLGLVQVRAINADTGRGVERPCVSIRSTPSREECGTNGTVVITDVPIGYWEVAVSGGASYFGIDGGLYIDVVRVGTTTLGVELEPAGSVTTTVVDAGTGQPVGSICVHLVGPKWGGQSAHMQQTCSDDNGVLAIGPFGEETTFQLYAWQARNPFQPPAVRYGAQWVTANGGSGDQRKALTVTVKPKHRITIPPIKVDPPGAISGVIRNTATGAPISGVCTYPYAFHPGQGAIFGKNCSNAQGQYTLEDLGPYDWPVEYAPTANSGYAWQWSGDVADRFSATLTKVVAGATAVRDARLVAGGIVAGTVKRGAAVVDLGYVWTYNRLTGDIASASHASIGQDGTFTLRGHRTQEVYVEYWDETTGCWYAPVVPGLRRPQAGVPVQVTAGATTTLAMDMVTTCAKRPYELGTPPVKPRPPL